MRTVNAARSLQAIATQASLYVPISNLPLSFPRYISLDSTSRWHTSALLSTAIESMTLPSRLRSSDHKRGTLDSFESALNVNGNQRIAQLQCTVAESKQQDREPQPASQMSQNDSRVNTFNSIHLQLEEDGTGDSDANVHPLDMDFFPGEAFRNKEPHVFGIVDSLRDDHQKTNHMDDDEEDEGFARKRRRIAGRPSQERYISTFYMRSHCEILTCNRADFGYFQILHCPSITSPLFLSQYIPCLFF